ncbi:hypothetical protein J8I87_42370 [Paraburkholderia sp. LEh10]|uniref:hypothetical protein n=1 Tax=Paraburkholderia sp. LEh10 TaxID=2821353 RepID=UPI001AE5E901|nr:hypothetical protein [Paraburkholderia sp. LEh10]MBP0596129.1 hypothetical protein [Paraburkholderia sp. LEh10]MBP0596136.1 hypothetical protein [Paraburkholderia sp. LEh10]
MSITNAYCGSAVNLAKVYTVRAIAGMDQLQPYIEAMNDALRRREFVSLYLIGTRAMGQRRLQAEKVPYEFVTFGENGQSAHGLRAELGTLLKAAVCVRIMAETSLETSANSLCIMLPPVDDEANAPCPDVS